MSSLFLCNSLSGPPVGTTLFRNCSSLPWEKMIIGGTYVLAPLMQALTITRGFSSIEVITSKFFLSVFLWKIDSPVLRTWKILLGLQLCFCNSTSRMSQKPFTEALLNPSSLVIEIKVLWQFGIRFSQSFPAHHFSLEKLFFNLLFSGNWGSSLGYFVFWNKNLNLSS